MVPSDKTPSLARYLFICGILLFILACNTTGSNDTKPSSEKAMLQAYDALHQRLQMLLKQDNAYAGLLDQRVSTAVLDESSGRIIQAEMDLQRTIDSLNQLSLKMPAGDGRKGLANITSHFTELLQSRRLLSDMRMALSAGSDDSTNAHQMLMRLRSDVQEKNEKIAALEKARHSAGDKRIVQNAPARTPASGETIEQLKQRNKALQHSLQAMEAKYFTVGRNYLLLKKEHERTLNELTISRKAAEQK